MTTSTPNLKRARETRYAWSLLAVPLLSMSLVFLWPLLQAFRMSFLDYTNDLYNPALVGVANYAKVIMSSDFQQALLNTMLLLIVVVPGVLVSSTALALAFVGNYPGMMLSRTLVYLPVVVNMIVSGMLWKWMLSDEGLVNATLNSVGLDAVPWLTSTQWVLLAVAVVVIWKAAAYYMMMLITRLESIPKQLYEVAKLDGANPLQRFVFVTLPQLRGMLALVTMICMLGTLKIFGEIYVLTRGGPLGASKTLIFYIYERAFQRLDLGIGAAAGILFALIIVVLTFVQRKLSAPKPLKPGGEKQ